MKSLAAFHCLVIATTSMVAAILSPGATAQEAVPNQASAVPPPPMSASVPERRFVSDKLVLNVYAEPTPGSERVATIETGDEVEELERADKQVRVRLEDGREGWVGSNYLVSNPPAIVRLRELERSQPSPSPTVPRVDKASAEEISQLKQENAALRGQVGELQSRVAAAAIAPPRGETIVNEGGSSETNSEATQPTTPPENMAGATLAGAAPQGGVWGWLLALMFVGAASFAGGYQTLARRLRKKFGGLKLY